MTDTSDDAVERLAAAHQARANAIRQHQIECGLSDANESIRLDALATAATLRALVAERAALRADRDAALASVAQAVRVVAAARCIKHRHDREPDGMVVSASHVRLLWGALDAYDAAIRALLPAGADTLPGYEASDAAILGDGDE